MNYWLVKSEPEEYSYNHLVRDGVAVWDGVRNPQAQKYLRQMKIGDLVLYYHTGKEKAVVAIAQVITEAYPDPRAPEYVVVDLKPFRALPKPIPLSAYRAQPEFGDFMLLRQPRLSVMPVPEGVWHWTLAQAEQGDNAK
ncbi:MAG: EVE domain-containing protein [Bacteroidia bacterium]|nr:EVE domain-containing protein [Bacteroidia bacterium]MDW8416369.1 EVE domain-containing protein [Bacteroidia bacterium]